jgi:hypothetical protein
MNAIKVGNTLTGILLLSMTVTFGFLKAGSPLDHITDKTLNDTYKHVTHFSQVDDTALAASFPEIKEPKTETTAGLPGVEIISPESVVTPTPGGQSSDPELSDQESLVASPAQGGEPIQAADVPVTPPPPQAGTKPEEKAVADTALVQPAKQPEPPQSSIYGGNYFSAEINPLTGLPVEDQNQLNRRPVMIKVSNYPRYGRPHAGLSFADIVFEYYIGEEANRFLAIFYSQDAPKIGPLRSGRLIDGQLVNLYQGVLSYGNADPKVEKVLHEELGNRAIPFSVSPCPAVCGAADTHTVAGVFVNSAEFTKLAIRRGVAQYRPDLTGTYFDPTPPQSDTYAINVGVEYSFRDRGEWHYDPESGTYLRWIEDMAADGKIFMKPLPDRLTGEQLKFSNVIILFAKYTEYAPTLHDVAIWNNFDGQRAVIYRDGMMVEGVWKVEDHESPIQFYDLSGKPVALKPGNTWIVVAGQSSTLDQVEAGKWEMRFHLP